MYLGNSVFEKEYPSYVYLTNLIYQRFDHYHSDYFQR